MTQRTPTARRLLVGIGNPWQGDDAVGRVIVRRLAAGQAERQSAPGAPPAFRTLESDGDPTRLLEAWKEADVVYLFDAICAGTVPGTIRRVDALRELLPPAWFPCSSHALGLGEAVALGRTLGTLPRTLILYGVEAREFETNAPLSPAVAAAVDTVVALVMEELELTDRESDAAEG